MSSGHMKPAPAQVRAAAEAADTAHKGLYTPPPDSGIPAVVPVPSEGPGNEPVLIGRADAPPQPGEPGHQYNRREPPVATPAPPADPPPEPPAPEEDFKQKYLSLQGKYNAELAAERQRVAGLEQTLAAVSAPLPLPTSSGNLEVSEADDAALAKLREEFGDDFVDTIVGAAERRIAPRLDEFREQLVERNKQVEAAKITSAHTARQLMYDFMNTKLEGWQRINELPAFNAWLDQPDLMAGEIRRKLLMSAYEANDGPRLAAFYLAYVGEQTAQGNAQPSPGLPAPPAPPKPSLDTFVAPGHAAPAAPPSAGAPQGRIYRRSEIPQFYTAKQQGAYRGRDAEWAALEQDIFVAGKEGRIHPG